jgi:predicted aspartyl protease
LPTITLNISPQGPLLEVFLDISQARRNTLSQAGVIIPKPIQVTALIDTGASCSCIDPSVIQKLNITPTGSGAVSTPLTGKTLQLCNKYDISVLLVHPEINYQIGAIPVLESKVFGQGIHALLGRDVLSKCLFIYNGTTQQYTISF